MTGGIKIKRTEDFPSKTMYESADRKKEKTKTCQPRIIRLQNQNLST